MISCIAVCAKWVPNPSPVSPLTVVFDFLRGRGLLAEDTPDAARG